MEALQSRPVGIEPVHESTGESSKSYLARIKSRLCQIPTPPSFISVPSSSSTTESTESLSTLAPTITATQPSTEPSTAATSVLSLPEVFMIQKTYVSPSMPIDEKIRCIWTEQIRSRLSAILLRAIPTGTCVQEFMGVGRKPNSLKPALVVSCGDIITKKRVERVFKSQGWLQELLKANGIIFVALVAKTSLSAGPTVNPRNAIKLSEACSVMLPLGPVATSCGASLLINAPHTGLSQQFTLGGLLWVDGEIFGLTAGHPFEGSWKRNSFHHTLDSVDQDLDLLEDVENDEAFDDPFIFNDDGSSLLESPSRTSTLSSQSSDELSIGNSSPTQDDNSHTPSISINWSLPFDAIIPLNTPTNAMSSNRPSSHQDWALVKGLPQSIATLPNKISHIDSRHDILLEEITSGSAHGEVTITVAGIGAQLGHLHSSAATMNVNGYSLDVQLITLENVLPLGSSGAWVILDRKLCGFIVAIRQDIPWAYMVPIEPILNDIKQKLQTLDVRLPVRGEIESLAMLSAKSTLPSAAEMTVEAVIPDGSHAQRIPLMSSSYRQQSTNLFLEPNDRSRTSPQSQDAGQLDLLGDINEVYRPNIHPSRPATSPFMPQGSSSGTSTCVSIFTGSNVSTAGGSSHSYSDLGSSSRTKSRRTWNPWASKDQEGHVSQKGWSLPFVRNNSQHPAWVGLYTEKPPPNKNHTKRQLRHILRSLLLRWLITAALCSLYILLILVLRKRGALNAITRKSFNTIAVGISIALSLNLAAAFKAMALNMRWFILHTRPHNLIELDLILSVDNLRNMIRLFLWTPRSRPILAVAILGWCLSNLFATSGIAMLSFTHAFVPGSISGALQPGNVSIPLMDHFYLLGSGNQTPTIEVEEYAAHLYGEYSQAWVLNSTTILPKAGEVYPQNSPMLWLDMDFSRMSLIFGDILVDNITDTSASVYTDRKINITWACDSHKVTAGGNGTTPNIAVDGLGNILVPETPLNSLAYFTSNTSNTYQCKNGPRCSVVQAFETSSTDPWYYSCEVTLSNTFDDPMNVSYISDQMAQIATKSITSAGFSDLDQPPAQIYRQPSPWATPHRGNETGMGLSIATFALGSIAGASIYNPDTTYEGMVPGDGLYLQLDRPYFFLIIGLVCGCHLLFSVVVAILANRVEIGPESHLEMSRLLQPVTRVLDGRPAGEDEKDWRRVVKVRYGVDVDDGRGKWGFVAL